MNRVRHSVIREVTTPEQWYSLLKSTDSTTQKKLVQVAADAARAQGLLAAIQGAAVVTDGTSGRLHQPSTPPLG